MKLSETHGADQLVVVLGAPEPEAAEISAETVVLGDPSYAGVLAGVQLGLDVYHVLDDRIMEEVPEEVWADQIGMMADVLDAAALSEAVEAMRQRREETPAGETSQ